MSQQDVLFVITTTTMPTKASQCPICCEAYTTQRRKRVPCNFCQHEACVDCIKKFLLTTHDDPCCMACRHAWTAEFIDTVLTRAFRMSDLRAHREQVLFDRERQRLPDTQQLIEELDERKRLEGRLKELRRSRRDLDTQIGDVEALIRASKAGVQLRHAAPRTVVRTCPSNGCRGFINDNWTCGLCSSRVCQDCHEVMPHPELHKCDPDVLASVQLLARDSRTCPNCPAIIYKIEGCDQMFCTRCHTAFSFQTGQVERGHIHNPHFYEWQRQQNGGVAPRVAGDDPCRNNNELPWAATVQAVLRDHAATIPKDVSDLILHMYYATNALVRQGLNEFNVSPAARERAKEMLRVRFLRKDITEERFKRMLHGHEQGMEKKQAQSAVLDTFAELCKEAFNRFVEDHNAVRIANDMVAVGAMATDQLRAINKRFGGGGNGRALEWVNSVVLRW